MGRQDTPPPPPPPAAPPGGCPFPPPACPSAWPSCFGTSCTSSLGQPVAASTIRWCIGSTSSTLSSTACPSFTASPGFWMSGMPSCDIGTKRSEEHTSELQSQSNLVCRLLLEKKKK